MDAWNTRKLPLAEWQQLIAGEYLSDFLPQGGSAVKFVVAAPADLDATRQILAMLAPRHGLLTVDIDAAHTRIHMLQDVFFAVARALDWDALLQRFTEAMFNASDYRWPQPGRAMGLPDLAAAFGIAEGQLRLSYDRMLTQSLWQNPSLARDFRSAMVQLSLAQVHSDLSDDLRFQTVRQWLRGEKVSLAQLRDCEIGARISRTNARAMLISLCHWLRRAGAAGLVLTLDLRHALTPAAAGTEALRYTPAALMDAYEVLREIIDDAEHLPGLLVVVLAGEELVAGDPRRSIEQYSALKMRVWPDVRPGGRQNPLAPLVRLAA